MTAGADFMEPLAPESALAEAARRWRKRSGLIRLWRLALPGAIGVLVLGFIGQLAVRAVTAQVAEQVQASEIRIVDARFLGRDSRGRQFEMRAREAVRVPSDPGAVRMFNPRLTVSRGDGRPVVVTSRDGYWNDRDQVARMTGDVVLTDPTQGYVFRTQEAVSDTRADTITGSQPVDGQGPFGHISAQSFAVYDQGARVVLEGQVRARLNQGRGLIGGDGAGGR